MRKTFIWAAAAVVLAVAGGAAWWLWPSHDMRGENVPASNMGRVLYYQDPSGAADYSPVPKKDAQGRDYVAVRAPGEATPAKGKKVIYYRNPMGLTDTSPMPKKDSMGMDYIPVYADEGTDEPGTVKINLDRVQRLGVRTAKVSRQAMAETVLLSGTVTADERKLGVVALKFQANVVKLHVAATGERVRKGQPLFDIQSPFLLRSELDLALALRTRDVAEAQGGVVARSNARVIKATRERLRIYEVPEAEIERLIRTGTPTGSITWRAPQDGVVIEKPIVAGMQAEPGATLYRLADLSNVWVIAEAPENALAIAKAGATARIVLNAYPGKPFEGKVTFVYPEVSMTTRTAKVRIELPNPDGTLVPGMFASVEVASPPGEPVMTVPDSALIDSGSRQVVLVARGEGRFEPRAVTVGRRANGMIAVLSGLDGTEEVVTSATFLIDAESNLRAALQSFTAGAPPVKEATP
ncbi:MAG: efflux RND transporter periplasmic adaptor subunit [Micropepsaceae bacterium]